MHPSINRVLVIGGGLSGLTAATQLKLQGIEVTVLDKGYGIGGRLASRSLKSESCILGFFDYGAQHFRAQDPRFKAWINELIQEDIVSTWSEDLPDEHRAPLNSSIDYRGRQHNRAIAQHLAKDLQVMHQTRIEALLWQDSQWVLTATHGQSYRGDAVIMTPPVPQTLEILDASDLGLEAEVRSRLEAMTYAPCFSLMVVCDRPSKIPAPGGIHVQNSLLDWVASNYLKGISPDGFAITLLAGPDFSQQYWDADTDWIITTMLDAAQPWLAEDNHAIATRLHRCKHRHPTTVFGARALRI